MSRLTFPITADGLMVDVRVNVDSAALASLQGNGKPIPPSIEAHGLIDTETDISAVAPSILQQLGIADFETRETQGLAGPVQVRVFKVTLFIVDAAQLHLPWFMLPDLFVMELPSVLPVDVLIGMDVIRTCKLLVDGPASQFTLDF